jgi:ribosomal protein L37AE/L43A
MFDSEKFEFSCPNCHNKISETVGRLNRGGYSCPSCGTKFDATELRRELEKAERLTKESLRKINESLNIKL